MAHTVLRMTVGGWWTVHGGTKASVSGLGSPSLRPTAFSIGLSARAAAAKRGVTKETWPSARGKCGLPQLEAESAMPLLDSASSGFGFRGHIAGASSEVKCNGWHSRLRR